MKAIVRSSILAICCGFVLAVVLTTGSTTYPSFNPDIWFNPKDRNPTSSFSEFLRDGVLAMANRNDLLLKKHQLDKLTMIRADLQEISDNGWIELVFGMIEGDTYLFRLSTAALQPSGFIVRHGYSCNAYKTVEIPIIKQRPVSVSLEIGDDNVSAYLNGKEVGIFKTGRRIPPKKIGFRFSRHPVLVKSVRMSGFLSGVPVHIDQGFKKGHGIRTIIASSLILTAYLIFVWLAYCFLLKLVLASASYVELLAQDAYTYIPLLCSPLALWLPSLKGLIIVLVIAGIILIKIRNIWSISSCSLSYLIPDRGVTIGCLLLTLSYAIISITAVHSLVGSSPCDPVINVSPSAKITRGMPVLFDHKTFGCVSSTIDLSLGKNSVCDIAFSRVHETLGCFDDMIMCDSWNILRLSSDPSSPGGFIIDNKMYPSDNFFLSADKRHTISLSIGRYRLSASVDAKPAFKLWTSNLKRGEMAIVPIKGDTQLASFRIIPAFDWGTISLSWFLGLAPIILSLLFAFILGKCLFTSLSFRKALFFECLLSLPIFIFVTDFLVTGYHRGGQHNTMPPLFWALLWTLISCNAVIALLRSPRKYILPIFYGIIFICLPVTSEMYLRATTYNERLYGGWTRNQLLRMFVCGDWSNGPWLFYVGTPTFRGGKCYSFAPPIGKKRIMCLGSSSTWGEGAPADEAYPAVVEKKLGNDRFEVLNCGIGGFTSLRTLMLFKKYLLELKPDIVTICLGFNEKNDLRPIYDFDQYELLTSPPGILDKVRHALHRSRLYMGAVSIISKVRDLAPAVHPRASPRDFERVLEEFVKICSANKIELVHILEITDDIYSGGKCYLDDYYKAQKRVAARYRQQVVDVTTRFIEHAGDDIFIDAVHQTPLGYEMLGEEIAEAIKPSLGKRR